MQSINAGFAGLRNLLPNHEGEKLSKAAILQQTSDYIYQLLQEKNKLLAYNNQLKRMASQSGGDAASTGSYSSPQSPAIETPSVIKRRKTIDGALESADEGIGSMSPEHSVTSDEARAETVELRREAMELRMNLERERRHRISLEEHIAMLQQQQSTYRKNDDRMQSEDIETFQVTSRMIHDETPRCYTVRNNLETIVEAIRHLEGDHLFSDDRNHSTPSSSPPSASPHAMDLSTSDSTSPNSTQLIVGI